MWELFEGEELIGTRALWFRRLGPHWTWLTIGAGVGLLVVWLWR